MLEADIVKHAPQAMTRKQREQFFEEGFLVLEGVIDDAWLGRLRGAMQEMIDKARAVAKNDERFVLEEGHSADDEPDVRAPAHRGSSQFVRSPWATVETRAPGTGER